MLRPPLEHKTRGTVGGMISEDYTNFRFSVNFDRERNCDKARCSEFLSKNVICRLCGKSMAEFSKYWVDEIDIAHWLIEPDSGTIKFSARSSTKDTVGGKWEDLEPIIVLVEGNYRCAQCEQKE